MAQGRGPSGLVAVPTTKDDVADEKTVLGSDDGEKFAQDERMLEGKRLPIEVWDGFGVHLATNAQDAWRETSVILVLAFERDISEAFQATRSNVLLLLDCTAKESFDA